MRPMLEEIEKEFFAKLETRKEDFSERNYHPIGMMNWASRYTVPKDLKTLQAIYAESREELDEHPIYDNRTDDSGYRFDMSPFVLVRGLRHRVISYLYRKASTWAAKLGVCF